MVVEVWPALASGLEIEPCAEKAVVLVMCLEGATCTRCQTRQIGFGPGDAGIMERWEEDFLYYLHFKVATPPLRSVLDESADISLFHSSGWLTGLAEGKALTCANKIKACDFFLDNKPSFYV